jgi:superfamily II DNA or RNA helicase
LVIDWFEEQWAEAEPFDLAALYAERWQPHPPSWIFYRMLHELYGSGHEEENEPIGLPVTQFQRDGISRALRILDQLDGVLVCDEVGLGKTYIAGEVIRLISHRDRQKVLIVVPASLKSSTWEPFLRRTDLLSSRVNVVTYDELRGGVHWAVTDKALEDYSLVVVDEAHNLRNLKAQRSEALLRVVRAENPVQVMLLTATPVNNSLADLHSLVSYFVRNDAQFANIGIPSVRDYITAAQKRDPDTLSPEHLFDLMDRVAVRRTRRFIKSQYTNDFIPDNLGNPIPIEFPTPVVKRLTYDLDPEAAHLAAEVIHALKVREDEELVIRWGPDRDPTRLSMARYAPSAYRADGDTDRLEIATVGLLRSLLLKRLESSTAALESTLARLITSHEAFLAALETGYVLVGDALRDYVASDPEDLEEFFEGMDRYTVDQATFAGEYDLEGLTRDVTGDLDLLRHLLTLAQARAARGSDEKVKVLADALAAIAAEAERPDNSGLTQAEKRKIIVFSTYADTVEDLHTHLAAVIDAADPDSPLAAYQRRVAPPISGSSGGKSQDDRSRVLAAFCPKTAGEVSDDGTPYAEDRYDLVVTSDVLSEGVNLQQAGRLVSYDLPWNPMKLVQRHGRIDRIGSPHRRVHIGVYFPDKGLDDMLHLEATLQRKIAYANAAIGMGEVLPGQHADPTVEVLLHDTHQDIIDIYDEKTDLLADGGGAAALSGEEYRRRLARLFEEDPFTRDHVLGLPYGSGTGFVSDKVRQAGYVFCIKIGDHPVPWFRFVAADHTTWAPLWADDGDPWIDGDTLTCLIAADPGDSSADEQVIADNALTGVFDAWAVAHDDVYLAWTSLTDPANIQPSIEKALRDAISLVTDHGGELAAGQQQDLIARLNGRWDKSIVRQVRNILRQDERSPTERVADLHHYVRNVAGLRIPETPKPLPPVRKDEIRVICWTAVQPAPQPAPETPSDMKIASQMGELDLGEKL